MILRTRNSRGVPSDTDPAAEATGTAARQGFAGGARPLLQTHPEHTLLPADAQVSGRAQSPHSHSDAALQRSAAEPPAPARTNVWQQAVQPLAVGVPAHAISSGAVVIE